MKRKNFRALSMFTILTFVFTLLVPFQMVVSAASNYLVIDNFPTSALTSWNKNSFVTSMQASADSYEGSYSLQMDFSNIINQTGTKLAYVYKNISMEGSFYNGIQFRIKGPDTLDYYVIRLATSEGDRVYYWDTDRLALGNNDWKRVFIPWSYFRNRNDTTQVATAPDMASMIQFRFDVYAYSDQVSSSGTIYLDDIRFADNRVDDYESGITGWSGDSYTTIGSETGEGNYYEGLKSMKWTYDFGTQPDGSKSSVIKSFSSAFDVAEYNGVSVWIKGDNSGNTLSAFVHTTNGGYTFETRPVTIDFSGWKQYVFYWKQFYRDTYVTPTSTDLGQIDNVKFNLAKQGTTSSGIYLDSAMFTHLPDLFANLDLNLSELASVKSYVDTCDYESAKVALLSYMRNRSSATYFYNWADRTNIMNEFNSDYLSDIDNIILNADNGKDYDFTFEGDNRQLDTDGNNDINWYQGYGSFGLILYRMGWWTDMGKAYWNSLLTTPDESYVTEIGQCLSDFRKDCPLPYAVMNILKSSWMPNGNCWITLGTGVRLDNYVGAYQYFMNSSSFTAEDNYQYMQSVLETAQYLYEYEATYQTLNWQIVECYGIYSAGAVFPEFINAASWKSVAKDYLEQHMVSDVNDDGFHKEKTFSYHEWMVNLFYKAQLLGQLNSDAFTSGYSTKLEKMFEVIMKMMRSNGYEPMLSDAASMNDSGLMALGAGLFSRGDFKYMGGDKVDSTLFWTTSTSVRNNITNVTATIPDFTSVKLDDTGYYTMRTQWKDGGNALVFDGATFDYGHYHRDQMNIDVTSNDYPIILDPGRGNYSDVDTYPSYFVDRAHNTYSMDGNKNPYHIVPSEQSWETNTDYDFVDFDIDYNAITPADSEIGVPYELRRKIYFAKPDYFIMNDIITASGTHSYEQNFNFAPSAIHIDTTTKAVEVNDFIDNFENMDNVKVSTGF